MQLESELAEKGKAKAITSNKSVLSYFLVTRERISTKQKEDLFSFMNGISSFCDKLTQLAQSFSLFIGFFRFLSQYFLY